jgi:YD repeat-containing protein
VTEAVGPKSYAVSQSNPPVKAINIYDPSRGRLNKKAIWKDGAQYAYTRYVYGTDHNWVQSWSTINSLSEETAVLSLLDGAGRERMGVNEHPGSVGGLSAYYRVFDIVGRVVEQSHPTEISNVTWAPTGDDSGYVYSRQAYDWKGRPTVTTNPDQTTKVINYTGCGCAGSDGATLTDEVGRQQKMYHDALGRVTKVEAFIDGAVYSTTTNSYNVRDEVLSVKAYQGSGDGSSCPTGTCQETTMTYDGYGRLNARKRPIESSAASYVYNADNTVQSVTDARGASRNLFYNARHLVTDITYNVPYGVAATPPASFSYDEAGNRVSMIDGVGLTSYLYDTQNRMLSETRYFNGLGNPYTLSYSYNLAGQLTSLTEPFGATYSYSYNKAGGLTSVTGAGTARTSLYANNFQYLAWGGLKHVAYGDSVVEDRSYTPRLQVASFVSARVNVPNYPPTLMSSTYQYSADGRIKGTSDLVDHNFDRAYRYDQVGRVSATYTAQEARNFLNNQPPPSSDTGPYNQSYQYDAWSNITQRTSRFWSQAPTTLTLNPDPATNRNTDPAWQYDAAGNILHDNSLQYDYDAAGRVARIAQTGVNDAQAYDGDGQVAKHVQREASFIAEVYDLRSSVLGGRVIRVVAAKRNPCNPLITQELATKRANC